MGKLAGYALFGGVYLHNFRPNVDRFLLSGEVYGDQNPVVGVGKETPGYRVTELHLTPPEGYIGEFTLHTLNGDLYIEAIGLKAGVFAQLYPTVLYEEGVDVVRLLLEGFSQKGEVGAPHVEVKLIEFVKVYLVVVEYLNP